MVIHWNNFAWSKKYSKNHLSLAIVSETIVDIFYGNIMEAKR